MLSYLDKLTFRYPRTLVTGHTSLATRYQVATHVCPVKLPNRKGSYKHRATSLGGCRQISRSKSVTNRFYNIFSHTWSYDKVGVILCGS